MRKNRIMLFAGATFVGLAILAGCGGRSGQKEYSKAMDAWESGELVQAQTLLQKSIRKMSGNEKKAVAWNQLGQILWALDKPAEAADAFNEACRISDTLTGSNLNLGIALFHAGRLDEARIELNNVLGEDPGNQTAKAMLAMISAKQRDWTSAAQSIGETVKLNPSDPAGQNALAVAELNSGRNAELVVSRLEKVTAAYPDYTPAIYNLAVIHERWIRDSGKALGYYREYLRQAGPSDTHRESAEQAVARLGSGGSTVAPRVDSAAAIRYMAEGARLHGAGKYADAITEYNKAVEADPKQKSAYYNMGLAYYAQNKYEDAVQACSSALSIDPRFADARYLLALSYFKQQKWAYAEREAKELQKVDAARGQQILNHIQNARN